MCFCVCLCVSLSLCVCVVLWVCVWYVGVGCVRVCVGCVGVCLRVVRVRRGGQRDTATHTHSRTHHLLVLSFAWLCLCIATHAPLAHATATHSPTHHGQHREYVCVWGVGVCGEGGRVCGVCLWVCA